MTPESEFKKRLMREIERQYPGAVILKNDANARQGIPDHIILFGPRWAMFEAKAYQYSHRQPNQQYYIDVLNQMSFASFVYPQNKEWFLNELQQALRPDRRARLSVRV